MMNEFDSVNEFLGFLDTYTDNVRKAISKLQQHPSGEAFLKGGMAEKINLHISETMRDFDDHVSSIEVFIGERG